MPPPLEDPQQRLLDALLPSVFGALDAAALALLREQLRFVAIAGGQTLIAQDEPGDSMYLLVSGRLRAYVRQDDGTSRMVREMARGQVIGEMSLITGEPRSATVVAIRDSVLARLEKPAFDTLVATSPSVAMALTRQIVQRLKTEHQRAPFAAPVTVGLLPVSDGVDGPAFAQGLAAALQPFGRVCVLDATLMAQRAASEPDLAIALDEIEARHDFVLLLADATPTPWTHLCARHSDELLLVADAAQPPRIHAVEEQCLVQRPPRSEAAQTLVLLHDAAVRCPSGTRAWLDRRPVTDHLHLRPTLARDLARLARVLARHAVGLVLGGGGARGFAHLGVLRALQERGVEIDCVGGTSIGALMAWPVALDRPVADLMPMVERSFAVNPTGDYNLFPFVSLAAGRRARRGIAESLEQLIGPQGPRLEVEDLWKSYFCIATNYSQAREEVLRSGNLMAASTASFAIPGALPPVVRDGDLLCDGGTFNNFPVDVMRAQRGIGVVIGVDLSARKPRRIELTEVPGTWALLRDRLRPRAQRRYRLPSLPAILLNTTILYSESRLADARRLTDVCFKPPLERVGLLDWRRLKDIERQGYEYARGLLERPEVAQKLKLLPLPRPEARPSASGAGGGS